MKILIPVDESPMSESAVQHVVRSMKPEGVDVLLVHAVEWPEHVPACFALEHGVAVPDVIGQHERKLAAGDALLGRLSKLLQMAGFTAHALVKSGHPRTVILACAEDWGADLIVMGSHTRHVIDRLLLGSVAEGVLKHARCSVEIIRERQHEAVPAIA
jgi:nucleotide-binding universal stress UspA family protein